MENIQTHETKKPRKLKAFDKRIHEVDLFRGFLILLVLFDHFCIKLGTENQFSEPLKLFFANWYIPFQGRGFIRFLALAGFCFTSGVSSAFSKNNWKRALGMVAFYFFFAVGANVLDYFLYPELNIHFRIDFNIIGVLAFSSLFYCLVQKRSWRILLVMAIGTFLLAQFVFPTYRNYNIPGCLDGQSYYGWTFYAPPLFRPEAPQADWMPLLPFMCFFFLGTLFSYFFYKEKKLSIFPNLKRNWERPICFLGRHSLLIYLAHQALYIPLFFALNAIFA